MDLDDVLRRCGEGELAPAVALVRLLIAYGDADRLRVALATPSAADRGLATRAGIARVRDLLAGEAAGSALVLDLLREERAVAEAADAVEGCRRLFDRLVGASPEASVARLQWKAGPLVGGEPEQSRRLRHQSFVNPCIEH